VTTGDHPPAPAGGDEKECAVTGPLEGVRVVELAGIGPAPFGVMLLADLGAEVVLVDRAASAGRGSQGGALSRNRRSIAVDLKSAAGRDVVLRLVETADVLVEGFRPGVAERLGVGPDDCHAVNPALVYGRMTGWGQDGPMAPRAGHDITYAAISGALHPVGRADDSPPPPINYVADFGGGGAYLAIGVLAALLERGRSGRGQIVDAAMVDGAASQTTMLHGMLAAGLWSTERASNLLDGGAPYYDTYVCADGGFLAVGALEPQFFTELCDGLEVDPGELPQFDQANWPEQKRRIAEVVALRTRDEWAERFEGTDACVAPVLALDEAPRHPHNVARGTFVEVDGLVQPGAAPRFSRTPGSVQRPAPRVGDHTDEILGELGLDAAELRSAGAVA
jgi:alpha-methylacyl-CoA racemase